MKKTVKISQLMDAYTDNEFFIQGESEVNMDTVKNNVVAKAGLKRKMKPMTKLLVAVAAVVGLSAVVGFTYLNSGTITTGLGRDIAYEKFHDYQSMTISKDGLDTVFTLENGRLYFNMNGEHTDITDTVDSQTPYIYSYTIPETGNPVHIIAGGTPEEYGVVEMVYIDGFDWIGAGAINGKLTNDISVSVYKPDSFSISYNKYQENDGKIEADGHWYTSNPAYLPPAEWRDECEDAWLIEGLLQLELIELP